MDKLEEKRNLLSALSRETYVLIGIIADTDKKLNNINKKAMKLYLEIDEELNGEQVRTDTV